MKNNETQMSQNNDFDGLVAHIQQTQDVLQNMLSITDPLERAFYETMAIRGTWSINSIQCAFKGTNDRVLA